MILLNILKIIGIVIGGMVGLVLIIMLLILFMPFTYRIQAGKSENDGSIADGIHTDKSKGEGSIADGIHADKSKGEGSIADGIHADKSKDEGSITGDIHVSGSGNESSILEGIYAKGELRWFCGLVKATATYQEKHPSLQIRAAGFRVYPGNNTRGASTGKHAKRVGKKTTDDTKKANAKTSAAIEGTTSPKLSKSQRLEQSENSVRQTVKQLENSVKQTVKKSDDFQKHVVTLTEDSVNRTDTSNQTENNKKSGNRKADSKRKTHRKKGEIRRRVKRILDRLRSIREFISHPSMRPAVTHVLRELLALLRHLRPRRIDGTVNFGMEGPDQTAILYGIAANLTGTIKGNLQIIPDLQQSTLSFHVTARGRLFLLYMVVLILRTVWDKDVRMIASLLNQTKS